MSLLYVYCIVDCPNYAEVYANCSSVAANGDQPIKPV